MTTVLDADTFASGGRGTPNAISPGSNGTNWLKIAGSSPTVSIVGTEGQFTGVSSASEWQLGTGTAQDAASIIRFQYSSTSDSFGLFLRETGTTTYYYVKTTATQLQIHKNVAGVDTSLVSASFTFAANTFYWLRFRVVGSNLYAKIWGDADPLGEPDAWTIQTTDSAITGAGGWGVRVAPNLTTDTVQIDNFQVFQVFTLQSSAFSKFLNVARISVRSRAAFPIQFTGLNSETVNKFFNGAPSTPAKAPINPYGSTEGINLGTPPYTSAQFLSNQKFQWISGMGMGWARINQSAWCIWYNHTDPVANWHFEALDDAISKAKGQGLKVSVVLRFVNPTDGSGTLNADGNRYAHYNTIQATNGAENWMMPNPPDVTTFAQALASRYNGTADVISTPSGGSPINYGKLKIDMIEIGNEEFHQHFSQPANPATIFGQYNDPIAYFNAYTTGVTTKDKHQPTRSPHWLVPCLRSAYPAIKAVHPQVQVAAAAMWDVRPGSMAAFTAGVYTDIVGTAKGYFDLFNFHLYTNKVLPSVGSGQCVTIDQAISDIDTAMTTQNDTTPVALTEIGWNADQLTTSSSTVAAGAGTIVVANANGAAVGGSMQVDTVASGHQETVTITSVSGTTIGATFVNAHSGSNYPVTIFQDCSEQQQSDNHLYCLNACMKSKRVQYYFIFTLDDSTSPSTSSVVQYGYNGAVGYHFMTAYNTIVNFIATNPSWNGQAISNLGVPDVFVGVDGIDTFYGIDGTVTFSGIG